MEVIHKMKSSADVRYQSEAAATVAAQRVLFPLEVSARKPTHGAAFAVAKTLIAQIEAEAKELKIGQFDIQAHSIRYEFESKGTVLLQLSCTLTLVLDGGPVFWPRAEAITRTLDLIQKHCEATGKEAKDGGVYTGQAQHGDGPPAHGA